jgi:hypothetical protein
MLMQLADPPPPTEPEIEEKPPSDHSRRSVHARVRLPSPIQLVVNGHLAKRLQESEDERVTDPDMFSLAHQEEFEETSAEPDALAHSLLRSPAECVGARAYRDRCGFPSEFVRDLAPKLFPHGSAVLQKGALSSELTLLLVLARMRSTGDWIDVERLFGRDAKNLNSHFASARNDLSARFGKLLDVERATRHFRGLARIAAPLPVCKPQNPVRVADLSQPARQDCSGCPATYEPSDSAHELWTAYCELGAKKA